ncbi:MAG: hypothetical protein ABWZ42_03535 [Ilumatobacteraceae bacterium]
MAEVAAFDDTGLSEVPHDPVGDAVGSFIAELLNTATVEVSYHRVGDDPPRALFPSAMVVAEASAEVLDGWITTITVGFGDGTIARVESIPEALRALPDAALRAAHSFRHSTAGMSGKLSPTIDRALRDTVIVELLSHHQGWTKPGCASTELLAETLEYLIELSGARVESRNLTHGVVITDAISDEPRLSVPYPSGLRDAKRSPLLFDGIRSVLLVDQHGRARTELQANRPERLHPSAVSGPSVERDFVDRGSLVALATRQLGGIGFFLREDRSIWTFLDGQPLVIRRSEHWSAFPLWLAKAIGKAIGGGRAVDLIVSASLMVSIRSGGAIFGIVDDPSDLDEIVAMKDRYDLRNESDLDAMRPETRLHHLIDGSDLDAQTLARFGELDGATILDRDGRLLAYGAILSSSDSEHEGARTAAAKSLSHHALAVLKVSEDGDITVFREGRPIVTLLPSGNVR